MRIVAAVGVALALAQPARARAQQTGRILVHVVSGGSSVEGVQVVTRTGGTLTDRAGRAALDLPVGIAQVRFVRIGYRSEERAVSVAVGAVVELEVELEEEAIETEGIVIISTRTLRRIEDEPLRVEVVPLEEVEEKLMMTPGDIAMLLNETSGLRVQPTAPSLGGASVRIQGLRGRYTQILSDGLPLYGGQTGSLGPLQIPPVDLGQVEVIKGVASALYGSSALGGVVNLISRQPRESAETELLLNQTTLGGSDVIGWRSAPMGGGWGYTLLASGHRQPHADVDDDGWTDLPSYRRAVVRPRLFWRGESGSSAALTVGGMVENRLGGTMPGSTTPTGSAFAEGLDTRRMDGGLTARRVTRSGLIGSVRGSASLQTHRHAFGERVERDQHGTGFLEGSLAGATGDHTWVIGLAVQSDVFRSRGLAAFDYTHAVLGGFLQDEWSPADGLTLSASGRLDRHDPYGTFFNPRLSALVRWSEGGTLRISGGTGYFAPTPWTDETEAVGLGRLSAPSPLSAERAMSGSADLAQTMGPFELNATIFGSSVADALQLRAAPGDPSKLQLINAADEIRTGGTELLARFERDEFHVSATYVYLRSTEPDPEIGSRREVPLTPRHTFGLVGAWEQEDRGRVGGELYYTGAQELTDDPYRSRSRPYLVVGFLVERHIGPTRVFLNAENIFDARQTRFERVVRPTPGLGGRWTTDVWGPLDGRTFNAGVRWRLGS
jgi:iron complex outermembrane receptor protein